MHNVEIRRPKSKKKQESNSIGKSNALALHHLPEVVKATHQNLVFFAPVGLQIQHHLPQLAVLGPTGPQSLQLRSLLGKFLLALLQLAPASLQLLPETAISLDVGLSLSVGEAGQIEQQVSTTVLAWRDPALDVVELTDELADLEVLAFELCLVGGERIFEVCSGSG